MTERFSRAILCIQNYTPTIIARIWPDTFEQGTVLLNLSARYGLHPKPYNIVQTQIAELGYIDLYYTELTPWARSFIRAVVWPLNVKIKGCIFFFPFD